MSKRICGGLSMALVPLLLALISVPAWALDMRSGEIVTVSSGEEVEEELYVAGQDIIIDGTVNDDVFAAGETVTINGDIRGDVFVCGRSIAINGAVERGIIAAGETVHILGDVGYDVRVAARVISITDSVPAGGPSSFSLLQLLLSWHVPPSSAYQ